MLELNRTLSVEGLMAKYQDRLGTTDRAYIASELGIGADPELTEECANEILQDPEFTRRSSEAKPTLFFVAGHPGSGKSTTSRLISESFGATVIHSDRIRGYLRDRGLPYVGTNIPLVSAVRNRILERVADGRHIVVDQFINPLRAAISHEITNKLGVFEYRPLSVWLTASKETLVRRLTEREPIDGHHTGRPEHLNMAGNFWEPDPGMYDFVFNTETTPTEIIGGVLRRRLSE